MMYSDLSFTGASSFASSIFDLPWGSGLGLFLIFPPSALLLADLIHAVSSSAAYSTWKTCLQASQAQFVPSRISYLPHLPYFDFFVVSFHLISVIICQIVHVRNIRIIFNSSVFSILPIQLSI